MIAPLSSLTKLIYDSTKLEKKPSAKNSTPAASTANSISNPSASVDLSPNNALEYFQNQANALKLNLPGMIADSLLQPLSDYATSQEPLNALVNQFTNPMQSFLESHSASAFTPDQMKSLQTHVLDLKSSIPQMTSNTLLSPFMQNAKSAGAVNGILGGISNRLNDLANQVRFKIQG